MAKGIPIMTSHQAQFMGIDPPNQGESFVYAIINNDLHPFKIGTGNLEEIIIGANDQQTRLVGVCGPPTLNHGIVSDPERRVNWGILATRGRPMDCRVAEYEILQKGVDIYRTPSLESKTKGWMRSGFEIYDGLKRIGFSPCKEKMEGKQ